VSLIGDALRKRQNEGGDIKAPAPQSTPPPAPEPSVDTVPKLTLRGRSETSAAAETSAPSEAKIKKPRKSKRPHKAWVELLMVIAGVIILGLIGFVLFFYLRPPATTTTGYNMETTLPAGAAPEVETPSKPKASIAATKDMLASVKDNVEETDDAIVTESEPALKLDPADFNPPAKEPESIPQEIAIVAPVPTPEATPSETASIAPAEPPPVIWPTFSLQAAMGGGKMGSVMIDGKIVPVGASHNEMSILEITPDGVVIEFQGQRRTFRVRR
jgi:hypothetical protein